MIVTLFSPSFKSPRFALIGLEESLVQVLFEPAEKIVGLVRGPSEAIVQDGRPLAATSRREIRRPWLAYRYCDSCLCRPKGMGMMTYSTC